MNFKLSKVSDFGIISLIFNQPVIGPGIDDINERFIENLRSSNHRRLRELSQDILDLDSENVLV